jgi:hypothetical protein
MRKESTPPDDAYKIYCHRLGHMIYFSYCRSENLGLPCFKIVGCWNERFLIEEFLRKELQKDDWDKAFPPPKSLITSLVEIIENVK